MTIHDSTTRRQLFASAGAFVGVAGAVSISRLVAAEGDTIDVTATALERAVRVGRQPPVGSLTFPVLVGGGLILLNNFGGHSVSTGACSHNGVDVFPTTSATRRLVSCIDGVIEGQRSLGGSQGNAWILKDADGVSYRYHHIGEFEPGLQPGDAVRRGDVIATMGTSGNANAAHLHFEVRLDGLSASAIDPVPLFALPIAGVSVGEPTGCA
ncbi:MAG: murein DD-endopeptidase MepM/ murein hydrolase activator NlpD [Candidatus Aldehydirespiratoraceae bacterium]|jgi:murein DD-endopeptidase MepM/ murein hydrolase activator NlpD